MSKISRKGKSLTRKCKTTNQFEEDKYKSSKPDKFESFFSLSGATQEKNKDDSLFSFETPVKYMFPEENETDVFKFVNDSNRAPLNSESFPEVPLAVFENRVSPSKNTNDEKTKMNDLFSKSKHHEDLDNSNLVFKNDSKFTVLQANKVIGGKNCKDNVVSNVQCGATVHDSVLVFDTVAKNEAEETNTTTNIETKHSSIGSSAQETTNQCPICLRTVSKYLSHMKSCAAKNNLSTQQLLSALKLHKKQIAERKELGLGLPVQSFRAKVSPKKSRANDKKGDSNLQLALALSASLHSAEEDELIQEAEALKEAGLCVEAERKLSTLEKFVFAPVLPRTIQANSKSHSSRPLLIRRTKEDRDRILSEKVAIVLITEEEKVDLNIFIIEEPRIKSRLLKKLWNKETLLWSKAHCSEEVEQSEFYVKSLSQFVTPSKCLVGEAQRRLSQLPGRLNTPKTHENELQILQNSNFPDEANFHELPTPPRLSTSDRIKCNLDTASTVLKCVGITEKTTKLSEDWRALIDSSVFSDVEVKCSGGSTVPAHKLVFHARCPSILQEVMREDNKDVLVCDECSRTSVLAFLEFVYSGILNIFQLSAQDLQNINSLAVRFDYSELKGYLKAGQGTGGNNSILIKGHIKKELFEGNVSTQNVHDFKEGLNTATSFYSPLNSGKFSNSVSNDTFQSTCKIAESDCAPLSDERGSPDMFGQSNVMEDETASQESREDLDILASLLEKTSAQPEEVKEDTRNRHLNDKLLEPDSPSRLSFSESASSKRKAQSRFSEDEDVSTSKKQCPDLSEGYCLENANSHDVFDLTQSSTSSNEKIIKLKENDVINFKMNNSSESEKDDYMDDLTQKLPPENSPVHSKDTSQNLSVHQDFIDPIWDGFDGDNLHFNYEFNTPHKMSEISLEGQYADGKYSKFGSEKKSDNTLSDSPKESLKCMSDSPKGSSKCIYISSGSKSPLNTSRTAGPSSKISPSTSNDSWFTKNITQRNCSLSPKSLSKEKHISSESIFSKIFSQKYLYDYSPQSRCSTKEKPNDSSSGSDVEFVKEKDHPNAVFSNFKPRRNLNTQFDFSFNSPKEKSSLTFVSGGSKERSQSRTSFRSDSEDSPQKNQEHISKSPSKKDSLTAMQRLLDDSLEISDSVFATANALLGSKGKESSSIQISPSSKESSVSCQLKAGNEIGQKHKSSLTTPSPEIIVSDNVTPLPDYSVMKTPSLKNELRRFGLKPSLGRRKAKLLLRYIYDQTHPFVPEPKTDTDAQKEVFKQPQGQPPKSPVKGSVKAPEINLVDSGSDSEESCSQLSTSSTVSSCVTLPEESFCEEEDFCSQDLSCNGGVRSAIRSLIVGNPELHKKVLLYEPIFLEEFMALLKTNGIKTNANYVMELLDEQCITFRTSSWKATNEKRRKKQRSPKKKTKNAKCNTINKIGSPVKDQADAVKKRGRPRKIPQELDKISKE